VLTGGRPHGYTLFMARLQSCREQTEDRRHIPTTCAGMVGMRVEWSRWGGSTPAGIVGMRLRSSLTFLGAIRMFIAAPTVEGQ